MNQLATWIDNDSPTKYRMKQILSSCDSSIDELTVSEFIVCFVSKEYKVIKVLLANNITVHMTTTMVTLIF
jgi:hypothetical protein